MTVKERRFWAVVEPLVGVSVGLYLCGVAGKQAARSALRGFRAFVGS